MGLTEGGPPIDPGPLIEPPAAGPPGSGPPPPLLPGEVVAAVIGGGATDALGATSSSPGNIHRPLSSS